MPRPPSARRPARPPFRPGQLVLPVVAVGLIAFLVGLVVVGSLSFYRSHLAAVALVDGRPISRDAWRERQTIELFRITAREARLREMVAAGRQDAAAAKKETDALTARKAILGPAALDAAVDTELLLDLAGRAGITISEADIDAALAAEAETPEARQLSALSLAPVAANPSAGPSAAERQAAHDKLVGILAKLRAGSLTWPAAVAATGGGGSAGWVNDTPGTIEVRLRTSAFALPAAGYTDVVEGADGIFRLAWVGAIAPASHDDGYLGKLAAAGVSMPAYRHVLAATVARQRLTSSLLATYVDQPSAQVRLSEIALSAAADSGTGGVQIKTRHILISPGHDSSKVSTIKPDDPRWAAAQQQASAILEQIRTGASTFEAAAKTGSDDKGSVAVGGELPYFSTVSSLDPAFAAAIFSAGRKVGDLIGPIRSSYGYHLIEILDIRPTPDRRIAALHDQIAGGADLAALARANSEAPEARRGGDLGWVARFQVPPDEESLIFGLAKGQVSSPLSSGGGYRLFMITDTAVRRPDDDQADALRAILFDHWYAAQRADPAVTSVVFLPTG